MSREKPLMYDSEFICQRTLMERECRWIAHIYESDTVMEKTEWNNQIEQPSGTTESNTRLHSEKDCAMIIPLQTILKGNLYEKK